MKSYMQATMERDRQKAEKAELDRLRAVNKELVRTLKLVQRWLLYDGPIEDDGITHPAFVKANNAVSAALAKIKGE